MILGRSYTQSHLKRPVVVFAPPAPTSQQQTIIKSFVPAVTTRNSYRRTFPLQGWDGSNQISSGSQGEYGKAPQGARNPNLGPRPPRVIQAPGSQKQQTITVSYRIAQKPPLEIANGRRGPHSKLRPPARVGAGIVFAPVATQFASMRMANRFSSRYAPHSVLHPAIIPVSTFIAPPISITYWASVKTKQNNALQRRQGNSKLFPGIVDPGIAFFGPGIRLADPDSPNQRNRRVPRSKLGPPQVQPVTFTASPISVTYWAAVKTKQNNGLQRRQGNSRLFPPAAVGAGIVFTPVDVHLAYSLRGRPKSVLRPPILPPLAPPISERIAVQLVRVEFERRLAFSRLLPPAVVGAGIVFAPADIHLSPGKHGEPFSKLSPPAVVGAGIVFAPVHVHLAYSLRGKQKSLLRPAIIPPLAPPVEEKLVVQLVRVELERRLAFPKLFPPAVVGAGIVFNPVHVAFTRGRSGPFQSILFPPILPPLAPPIEERLSVQLVRKQLERRLAFPKLLPPAVVGAGIVFRPLNVTLVRGRSGPYQPILFPPAVVGAGITFAPVDVHLAYSLRGRPKSVLRGPIIPPLAAPIETRLAVQLVRLDLERRLSFPRLLPPAIVGAGIVFTPVDVHLAYSRRGIAKSVLRQPIVTAVAVFATPIRVVLQRVVPPHVHPHLQTPAVIGGGVAFGPPGVVLAYSLRGRPKSVLRAALIPPLAPPIEEHIAVQLTRTDLERRLSFPKLLPPAVIGGGVTSPPVGIRLTYSQRGTPKSSLRPPTVTTTAVVFRPIDVELTYSRRGRPSSILRAPIIPPLAQPIEEKLVANLVRVELADRGPHSHLFGPAVIGAGIVFRPLDITLVRGRFGPFEALLFPPVIPPLAPPVEEKLSVQLTRVETERRLSFPRLLPPVIVGAGIVFAPLEVHLAYSRRGLPQPILFPPAVVGAGTTFRSILVHLAPSTRGKPKSQLFPPIIPPVARPVETELTVQLARTELERRLAFPRLEPPAVVGAGVYFRSILVHLAPSTRGKPKSELFPPAIVGAGIVFAPIRVVLTYSARGKPKISLFEPAVIGAGIVFAPIKTQLAPQKRGRPESILRPPILPPLAPPVHEAIVTQLIRIELADRQPHSKIFPPAVIGAGIVFAPIKTTLALRIEVEAVRRASHSGLHPPTVVQPQALLFFGPGVHLAYSRRGLPKSILRKGIVGAGIVFRPLTLSYLPAIRRLEDGQVRRKRYVVLGPPRVLKLQEQDLAQRRLKIVLVRIRNRPTETVLQRAPHSNLHPPAVVGAGKVFRSILVHLAYSRRGTPKSFLAKPIIPPLASPIEAKLVTALVRVELADRQPHSRLFPPAVVGAGIVFPAVFIHLAPSTRGVPQSHLLPPAVVGAGIVFRSIDTTLAPQKRGQPKSVLHQPIIPPLAPPSRIKLARIKPVHTNSILRKPAVVGAGIVFRPVNVELAPSYQIGRQRRFLNRLAAPTVVQSATLVFFGPETKLAASTRGQPFSHLSDPAVIGAGVVFRPDLVHLAASYRGRPSSVLHAPALLPPAPRPVEAKLTVQLVRLDLERRLSFPRLAPPVVVRTAVLYPIATSLAPSTRGRPKSVLIRLAVVPPPARPIRVTLAPQPKPKVKSKLAAPTVVLIAVLHPIRVQLAPQPKPVTHSHLANFIVAPPARPIVSQLVRTPRIPVVALLEPPVVIGAGEVFAPIKTALARIAAQRGRLIHTGVVATVFTPSHGDVCGDIFTSTDACDDTGTSTTDSGGISTTSAISGLTGSGSTMVGGIGSPTHVSGDDRKNR